MKTLSRRVFAVLSVSIVVVAACAWADGVPVPGRNVNMVAGTTWPDGDPFLQRQNEPSIAVSSRNPQHLLAGGNDYRTVDLSLVTDRVVGDAWLGVFRSYDGGLTWRSTLLPGCPYNSPVCDGSPLKTSGFQVGADATVRAGTNGMFFYTGIAFNRADNQPGAVFMARFVDDNNKEGVNANPIRYLDTTLVDTGNAGQFLDKPWLAVAKPEAGGGTCTIPAGNGAPAQSFPAGNIYVAYARFVGNDQNIRSQIVFNRSTDCGVTWRSQKLSEGFPINQGTIISIDPSNSNTVYVAWRQFQATSGNGSILNPDAFVIVKSTDGGQTFTKPTQVTTFVPFDQGATQTSFRTNAFPTMAVDSRGRVYLAFSSRVNVPGSSTIPQARVHVMSSSDGLTWSTPQQIDPVGNLPWNPYRGHQIMPAMWYAGGRLMLVYYDLRESHTYGALECVGVCPNGISDFVERRYITGDLPAAIDNVFGQYVTDQGLSRRHTLDVRAALAIEPPLGGTPTFISTRVSEYPFGSLSTNPPGPIRQLKFNAPNLPMFALGTKAFIGDYIDVNAQAFLPGWTYNTAASNANVFHAIWADNRDVKPPADGNWANYTPIFSTSSPGSLTPSGSCLAGQTGARNQNLYTSRISEGLVVGSLGNSKQLGLIKRAFTVFVQNTRNQAASYRLTIAGVQPTGQASFLQFSSLQSLDVNVAARSTIARSVYVTSSDPHARVTVNVVQIAGAGGAPVPGGLQGTVVLNPDITNPDITNPDITNPDITNTEIYNPDITNPDITNPDITNPDITNPDITNPDITNPDITNPDITNPDITNPDITNPDITNPDITNPDITNPDITNDAITDATWKMTNKGNTAASYNVKLLLNSAVPPNSYVFQLILHKTYNTPAPIGCTLGTSTQNILLASIRNPVFNPTDPLSPDITNPDITNATLALGPGETGRITVRLVDKNLADGITINPATDITPIVVAHSANTLTTTPPVAAPTLVVATTSLPNAVYQTAYSATLLAAGGNGPYTWAVGGLPAGLSLNSATGVISGTPTAAPGIYSLSVQVTSGAQTANRTVPLRINGVNLVFTTQPSASTVNFAIFPAVKVRAQDATAAPLPGVSITLALGSNPGAATLSGTTTQVTDATGIATFANMALNQVASGYTLVASTPGAPSTTSTPFNVVSTIFFESLPNGTPACLSCNVTNEFATGGVVFSYASTVNPAVTWAQWENFVGFETAATADNHGVTAGRNPPPGGGYPSGTLSMSFAGLPVSANFSLKMNDTVVGDAPIVAYDKNGVALPPGVITRTTAVYTGLGGFPVRHQNITVTSNAVDRLSKIEVGMSGFIALIDNLNLQ